MSVTRVKALFVSSLAQDQQFLSQLVSRFEYCELELCCIDNCEQAKTKIKQQHYDILLIGTESELDERFCLLNWLHNDKQFEPAALMLTHNTDQRLHQHSLKAGAVDSINLDCLTPALLERSIRYAIRHKADELRLLKLAHHDPLTGLANRLSFKNHLVELMAQNRRSGHFLALMIIDLDNFKTVNDSLGHDAGDEVLITVAQQLQSSVRETDLVARLGGDEFAIIATHLHSTNDAAQLARTIIRNCHVKSQSDEFSIEIGCTLGIALYPSDGKEHNILLKHADNALLSAKKSGKGCFLFADQQLNLKDKFQHALDQDIHNPLFISQLELHYQPIIALDDKHLIGAEALLRWNHPKKGLMRPDKFLAAIESNGLMNNISHWVIYNACIQHMEWTKQKLPPIPVSVNISALQLENPQLVNTIEQLINNKGFDPHYLCLELSEADAFNCSEKVHKSLSQLHNLGVHLTIDNFGKDYCSLTQLHRLPIDTLKIDRSLIQRIQNNHEFADVTEAIIQLGKVLNLNVIAHGVENEKALDYLNERDCNQAQGFYIAEPLSADSFPKWLKHYNNNITAAIH